VVFKAHLALLPYNESETIMATTSAEFLTERLELAEALRLGRERMLEPQDLPGRYGRVIKAIDRLLQAINCESVVGGGWAVWRHGFVGRVTQDVDIVLAADRIDEFLRAAAVSGFDVLKVPQGRWPKIVHKETGVTVDILPEGQRPGTPSHPAPTTLPAPATIGASGNTLRYITLPALVELKLAAGLARDEADVVELIRANPAAVSSIRQHLAGVHPDYAAAFDHLFDRARDQQDP
jgi:hypothetical protein